MAVAVDRVITELVARIPRCPGFSLYDSWPLASDTNDFVAVGVSDPLDTNAASSATADLEWAHVSRRAADESGEVVLCIAAVRGETEVSAVRAVVVGQLNAIDDWLRGEQYPFGLPTIWDVKIARYSLLQDQTEHGATCAASVHIAYRARI